MEKGDKPIYLLQASRGKVMLHLSLWKAYLLQGVGDGVDLQNYRHMYIRSC